MTGLGEPNAPWDAQSARACGIDWLLAETAPAGAFGRTARAGRTAFGPGDEAAAARAAAACAEFARRAGPVTLAALRDEIARAPDIRPAALRARDGATLADADFSEALRFAGSLAAIGTIAAVRTIALGDALAPGSLGFARTLAAGAVAGSGFYLADAFDPELAAARERAESARARADLERSRLDGIARAVTGATPRGGEFVIMRDDLRGALPPAIRVIREAPTYVLCETVPDDAALAAMTALEAAELDVAGAEDRVRLALSRALARDAGAVVAASLALGELDVAVAEAAFAARHATCVPEIPPARAFEVEGAAYLPLATRTPGGYVALDVALDDASVLTGPNMGGKSTALRTAGFVAACVALGLPVPARRARIALFARIAWLAPTGAERPESGLSAFGGEIAGVREVFEGPRRALVLVDEFARTTTPREGRALLIALIERLRDRGALVFAATHASGVAAASGATPLALAGLRAALPATDTNMPIDRALSAIAERMDFRIVRVAPGDAPQASHAIALARALGIDAALADRADAIARESPA